MSGSGPIVGHSPGRRDGPAKVTGRASFVADDLPDGCWFGATVRSVERRGRLRSLARGPGFPAEAVLVTAADIPGENIVALIEDDQPALVSLGGEVRHWGEPIALVAAPTRGAAERARAAVIADIEVLPPELDGGSSPGDVAHLLHEIALRTGASPESVFPDCAHVIEGAYRTGAQEQMYIEPQGIVARWDGRRCHVRGSLQCPYYVHAALCRSLAAPAEDVAVEQAVTGGGFGGKEEYPSLVAIHAALLARRAGAPVALIYARGEDIAVTPKRHASVIRHRLGIDAEGRIRAVDIDITLDGGAYTTLSPVVLSRAVLHAAGPYRVPSARIRGRVVRTNRPPAGAFRGFGAPQAIFACERQLAKAARLVGVEPLEVRRRNALRDGDATVTGHVLGDCAGGEAVLRAVAERGAREWPARGRPPAAEDGRRRGTGIAFWFHGAGFTGSGETHLASRATVELRADGHFSVLASSAEIGQGAATTFAQIAADALGVPASIVEVEPPATDLVPDSGPTVASRTCMVVGGLVAAAAGRLARRLRERARQAGAGPDDWQDVARRFPDELCETAEYAPPPDVQWDEASYRGAAYATYGWACCRADVAVDPDTYEVEVERIVHAVDVGRAIHPRIVRGQIEGGTLQALGWALWEGVDCADGRVAQSGLHDCIIPTALDAPEMETIIVEVPFAGGPFGAKGVGEIPVDGPAAAVASALEDALGAPFDELPVRPERIEEAWSA